MIYLKNYILWHMVETLWSFKAYCVHMSVYLEKCKKLAVSGGGGGGWRAVLTYKRKVNLQNPKKFPEKHKKI